MAHSKDWSLKKKVFASIGVAFLVLFVALQHRNNSRPNIFIPPPPPLPSPNARDFFIKACDQIQDGKLFNNAFAPKKIGGKLLISPGDIQKILDDNREALKTFHEGLKYPYQEPAQRSYAGTFPHFAKFRNLARLLSFEAKIMQQKQDWNEALKLRLDCVEMGSKIPRGGSVIAGLVGVAVEAIGSKSLEDMIPHLNAFSAKMAARRVQKIADNPISYADLLQEEKYTGLNFLLHTLYEKKEDGKSDFGIKDLLEMIHSDDENSKSRVYDAKEVIKFYWIGKAQTIRNYSNYMDTMIAQARQPYALHLPPPSIPDDPFNKMLAPVFAQAREKFVTSDASNAQLAIALALQSYKMDHDNYPSNLEQLVPAYLSNLPEDPRALKGSFGYQREKESYTLFSNNLK